MKLKGIKDSVRIRTWNDGSLQNQIQDYQSDLKQDPAANVWLWGHQSGVSGA